MANFAKTLINRIVYGASSALRDYETLCLNCFREQLSPALRQTLDEQIRLVELVQRFSMDKLVVFHFKQGNPAENALFPNRLKESHIAKVILISQTESMQCEIVLHEGRLSSLEFDLSPLKISTKLFSCKGTEIYSRFFQQLSTENTSEQIVPTRRMLREFEIRFQVSDIMLPETQSTRISFLRQLSSSIPNDYVELLEETNGFTVEHWVFYGTNARSIVLPDNNYYLVCESSNYALCFQEKKSLPITFIYDQVNDELMPGEGSFIATFINAINNSNQ